MLLILAMAVIVMICKYVQNDRGRENDIHQTHFSFRLAEDILDDDPSILTIGNTIRIRWTDGTTYQCKYLGRQRVLLYQIELPNEIRQLRRHEFVFDRQMGSDPSHSKDRYHRRQPISTRRKRRRTRPFGMTKKRRRHV